MRPLCRRRSDEPYPELLALRFLETKAELLTGVDKSKPFLLVFCVTEEKMAGAKKNAAENGVVTEALPDTLFRVRLGSGVEILAYLAGKMRMHRIRVLIGDQVLVEIDPYGGKGRIVKRM